MKKDLSKLRELEYLLDECKSINHGSGVVDRLIRIEKLARDISEVNLDTGEESFFSFIIKACHEKKEKER